MYYYSIIYVYIYLFYAQLQSNGYFWAVFKLNDHVMWVFSLLRAEGHDERQWTHRIYLGCCRGWSWFRQKNRFGGIFFLDKFRSALFFYEGWFFFPRFQWLGWLGWLLFFRESMNETSLSTDYWGIFLRNSNLQCWDHQTPKSRERCRETLTFRIKSKKPGSSTGIRHAKVGSMIQWDGEITIFPSIFQTWWTPKTSQTYVYWQIAKIAFISTPSSGFVGLITGWIRRDTAAWTHGKWRTEFAPGQLSPFPVSQTYCLCQKLRDV